MTTENNFRRLFALGYHRLVPIIPPGAPISERSTLFKRVGTSQDGRGKTPGTVGRDGKWSSYDWLTHETSDGDLDRWNAMGAGVGIMTGQQPDSTWLVGIDADTLNPTQAVIIRDAIDLRFGRLPIRVGQSPKALYVCRVNGPLQYQRVEFGARDERGVPERVEILSEGRQFVAFGVHPKTGAPYEWPRALVPFEDLPVIDLGAARD